MNPTTWWLFACMELVLCLTPGPAVLYVISSGLRAGARRSIASTLGILAANAAYFLLSATGVGAVLAASYNLFFAVKWIGAAYLVFIGLRALFGKAALVAPPDGAADNTARRLFRDGFILQASNPKAIVFFSAVLPQFLDLRPDSHGGLHATILMQVAILGVTSNVIEFFVLLGYGAAAGQASAFARQPRYANWTNRIAGVLLMGAGAGLATLRRT
jgi:threonine/homoserine/homoserine lactone efflux protein